MIDDHAEYAKVNDISLAIALSALKTTAKVVGSSVRVTPSSALLAVVRFSAVASFLTVLTTPSPDHATRVEGSGSFLKASSSCSRLHTAPQPTSHILMVGACNSGTVVPQQSSIMMAL